MPQDYDVFDTIGRKIKESQERRARKARLKAWRAFLEDLRNNLPEDYPKEYANFKKEFPHEEP